MVPAEDAVPVCKDLTTEDRPPPDAGKLATPILYDLHSAD